MSWLGLIGSLLLTRIVAEMFVAAVGEQRTVKSTLSPASMICGNAGIESTTMLGLPEIRSTDVTMSSPEPALPICKALAVDCPGQVSPKSVGAWRSTSGVQLGGRS